MIARAASVVARVVRAGGWGAGSASGAFRSKGQACAHETRADSTGGIVRMPAALPRLSYRTAQDT
jgi:hypothetical protein